MVFGSNLWILGTHGHYLTYTTLPATTLLTARVTAAELIHKAASYIQQLTRCSSDKHWAPTNQNKKERGEYLPLPSLRIQMKA